MTKILVLYYSMYGHVETMAYAAAKGVESAGVTAIVKRVPELMDTKTFAEVGGKTDQQAAIATPEELPEYDGFIFATPTRFGNMAAQMRNFLDQTGKLWAQGDLVGKPATVITSTAVGGGSETTITSFHNTLLHHGMVVVGLPYSCPELLNKKLDLGGSPYGAATIAGSNGKRGVAPEEMAMASFQGKNLATIAKKLCN